jgi:3,4-dihydroxy-2-butanone 4-phosphate synthase
MAQTSQSDKSALFDTIEDAIKAFSNYSLWKGLNGLENGDFIVVMDDESRENEGDLMMPAQFVTTEKFAFLVRHSR